MAKSTFIGLNPNIVFSFVPLIGPPGTDIFILPRRRNALKSIWTHPLSAKRFLAEISKENAVSDENPNLLEETIGLAPILALIDKGWKITPAPGFPITRQRGEEVRQPFAVFAKLAFGGCKAEEWREKCDALGISEIGLGWGLTGGSAGMPDQPDFCRDGPQSAKQLGGSGSQNI
jgi:hypothetical protein